MKFSKNKLIDFGKIQALFQVSVIAINEKLFIEYTNDYVKEMLHLEQNVSLIGKSIDLFFNELKIPLFSGTKEITNPQILLVNNYFQKWQRVDVKVDNKKKSLLIGQIIASQDDFFQKIAEEKTISGSNIISLNKVIENLPELVYWKDKDGVYQGCNKHVAELLNLSCPAEIIGKTDYDLGWSADRIKNIQDIDRAIIQHGIRRVVEDTIPIDGLKKRFITSKSPLYDDTGNIVGILGISTDITERKKMEEQLRKARATTEELERLDNIIKYAPDIIYWKDRNSIYLGCNNQFVISAGCTSREEIIGKSDFDFPWHKYAKKYRLDDKEVIESGLPKLNIEDRTSFENCKQATVITNKVPLRDSNNKVVGVLGIATDITARKKMENLEKAKIAAEAANHAKSEFIANMSHDIRTPLTGIFGMTLEMLNVADDIQSSLEHASIENSTPTEKKYLSLLNQIIETVQDDTQLLMGATDELLQLCNEILETISLEYGKSTEQVESFNLRELIEHNIELMQPVARHKKLKLIYEIDEQIPIYVKGLHNYLDRTLLNLLTNALKFTDKGFVRVAVQLLDKKESSYQVDDNILLRIAVEDSGIGIPKNKFEVIFEHFSRLTPSYQGLYKGAGLGLYTVKRYIEAMQAQIKVESEVGTGTCFTLTLPLTVSDHTDRSKVSIRPPRQEKIKLTTLNNNPGTETDINSSLKTRVLIVEDNLIAARAIQSTLNRLGYTSDIAENGMKAIKIVQHHDYDLILMDIGLPDIDGITTAKRIRALEALNGSQIPIIALTGHASDSDKREKALEAGMQDVFSKPLPPSKLESILQKYALKSKREAVHKKSNTSKKQKTAEIIDWEVCVDQLNGDENCVRELLAGLAVDLKISQEKIAKAFVAHDEDALRTELHRVRGGVCYLTLPQLDRALASFHEAVKAKPQNQEQIEHTYELLQKAMDAFWITLEQGQFLK